jgi:hypothetical protein
MIKAPIDKAAVGWVNGFLGMLIFSGSLPATRVAVASFDPVFLTVARAVRRCALCRGSSAICAAHRAFGALTHDFGAHDEVWKEGRDLGHET